MSVLRTMLWESKTINSTRIKNGNGISLSNIKSALEDTLTNEYQLNVEVAVDVMESGKIFDRSKKECITIKNREHMTDYNYHVITFSKQGIYCIFDFYMGGTSKNAQRINAGEKEHSTLTGTIIGSIRKAMVSNDASESEDFYYTMVDDAIKQVLFNE